MFAMLMAVALNGQVMAQAIQPKPLVNPPTETTQPLVKEPMAKPEDRVKDERLKDLDKEHCSRELAACTNLNTTHCKEVHDKCAHVTK